MAGSSAPSRRPWVALTLTVYELNGQQRACPSCGHQRQEIGSDESWQVEYFPGHFERIHHVCKKYACTDGEHKGDSPQMEVAAKSQAAIDKAWQGPGCWLSL
jgi:transposase